MDIEQELKELDELLKLNNPDKYVEHKIKKEDFDELISSSIYRETFTERELDRRFRELLKPFRFEHGEKEIYCRFTKPPEDYLIIDNSL